MNSFALHILTAVSLFSAGAIARADDAPQNVWFVSTRDLSPCQRCEGSPDAIRYWRWNDGDGWSASDSREFHDGDETAMPTVIYIHGNQTDADGAAAVGWFAYQTIRSATGCRPFRFVIWSWPADRLCRRNRPDAQIKAGYSDVESRRLAAWLDDLRPGVRISLVGHSFGPRIITGALHLLAGGEVAGHRMSDETVAAWSGGRRNPIRAVLLASAIDAGWLAPDARHGLALSLFDQALVTRNGCDRALRFYSRLYGRGGPEALGFVGPYGVGHAENLEVVGVGATVGKTHDVNCYLSASNLCDRWARYTFLDDEPENASPEENPRASH